MLDTSRSGDENVSHVILTLSESNVDMDLVELINNRLWSTTLTRENSLGLKQKWNSVTWPQETIIRHPIIIS